MIEKGLETFMLYSGVGSIIGLIVLCFVNIE